MTSLPELRAHRSGAVKVTTGLGLPLSRGFAHAAGGWLALEESTTSAVTHLWCTVEASLPPTALVLAADPSAPAAPSTAAVYPEGGSYSGITVSVDPVPTVFTAPPRHRCGFL